MLWKITIAGTMVALDEDMPNWPTDDIPYAGSLNGMLFEASDVESGGGVCAFRGGTLSGRFSEDGLAFDADETVEWGSSTHPTIVRRRWTGHKL